MGSYYNGSYAEFLDSLKAAGVVIRNESEVRERLAESQRWRTAFMTLAANGRALGMGETTGFVKMLADATSDRIVGVHIVGANASELISEAVVAMEFGAASEDLARIVHAHPTLSEVLHEAALACDKRALHF